MKNKIIIGMMVSMFSSVGIAQSVKSYQIKVGAKVIPGCLIEAEDFVLSAIDFSEVFYKSVIGNLNLQCSKGISVSIAQTGVMNSSIAGRFNNFVSINNIGNSSIPGGTIPYWIKTTQIQTNDKYSVIYKPSNESLGRLNLTQDVKIKILTNANIALPFTVDLVQADSKYGYRYVPGNYGDTVTYTITY